MKYIGWVKDYDVLILKIDNRREWWTGERWRMHQAVKANLGAMDAIEVLLHYNYITGEWRRP